jgi:predicted esterase
MRKNTICFLLLILLTWAIFGQEENTMKFDRFDEVQMQARTFLKQKNYAAAITLYEAVQQQFPGNRYDILWNLIQLHVMAKNPVKSVEALEQGVKAGLVFPIWKEANFWKPLEKSGQFPRVWQEHLNLKRKLSGQTDPQVQVITPVGYKADSKYPLLLVLHGWNENIHSQEKAWHSPFIDKKYILAFVQSSQVEGQDSYGWSDFSVGRQDIRKNYQHILQQYSVDERQVILGGFSQGGMMVVDSVLAGVIPVSGFFLLQPGGGLPPELTVDKVRLLADRGLQGTILTGADDFSINEQRQMAEIFKSAGLPCRLVVEPAGGHGVIADLPVQLDAALAIIDKR